MNTNPPYPTKLSQLLRRATCRHQVRNRMGGVIRELWNADGSCSFLKIAPSQLAQTLRDEYARLVWLTGKLPVPEVVYFDADETLTYLLLSELPGDPAHQVPPSDIKKTLETVAHSLRELHAIDIRDCPFVGTLEKELRETEAIIANGELDVVNFEEENAGTSVEATLRLLRERQGEFLETCFTHGDYCLPNIIVRPAKQFGIVDWGACGVADPCRDFSAIDGSIRRNFGDSYVEGFFDAYGITLSELDRSKIEYYKLIDKYFLHRRPKGEFL